MKKIESFIRYFINKITINEADFASAFLAFHILLSFIPILVFISNMIVTVVPNFNEFLYDIVNGLPNDVQNIFIPVLDNIFNDVSTSLSIISVLSALWLGSRGFLGLIKALNKIFEVKTSSKIPFFYKIFSVILTVAFMVALTSILLFSVFNERLLGLISSFTDDLALLNTLTDIFLSGLLEITPMILSALLLAFLYRFAPSFNKETQPNWKSLLLGSFIGSLGIYLVTFFYKFTNDVLQRSPSIYGSLGSVLVTLIWLLAICNILIWGAALIKTFDDIVFRKRTIYDLEPDVKLFTDKK